MRTDVTPLDLLGSWRLERRIDDHRDGRRLRASGRAVLVGCDERLVRWHETGELRWDGGSTPFRRTLFVQREPGGWQVRFEDRSLFHPWAVAAPVTHLCAPDDYRGEMSADDAGWSVRWRVTGPAKHYDSLTDYTAPHPVLPERTRVGAVHRVS